MDHHTVAAVSIAGSCLDVLGSLYLAYDILGGQHGPLRLLTRAVTYSIVFGLGFGFGLGILFGFFSGVATGVTVAIEMHRESKNEPHYSLPWETFFSVIRSIGFGAGLYSLVGLRFGAAFAAFMTLGQVGAYIFDIRPAMDYAAVRRPRLSHRQIWTTLLRTVAYITAAMLCSVFVRHVDHPWLFALRLGVVTGVVTGVGAAVNPYIEYYADNLPERRLGAFGVGLIFIGFALQSLQYWVAVLDVRLT
jgi:hypothetical protein